MSSIEEVAKSWLVDPAWQKVFKHTIDVIEDYICYILVAIGTIALSVRLLTTLSTGDLVCILIGVENATTAGSLLPYAEGGTLGMINYAQTEEDCIRNVFSYFMEYLPYILLLQTLLLVIVEKFTFKIPRIAQKVERFYKNIVEESLFGKDPDVTEDITDPKTSTEAISRRRQRNEICVSLKRSSIIHHVYIGKNVVECFLVLACLVANVSFALDHTIDDARCDIDVAAFPGVVDTEGVVHFQCKGKKQPFFILILWIQIALLSVHLVLSVCAIIWCWQFRAVTNLLRTIEAMRQEWEPNVVSTHEGEDFLFLFDLLAHSCGLEATLRVLTHSDLTFYKICRPKLMPIQLEEDKMKISWQPADIEQWLNSTSRDRRSRSHRGIIIDSYEVTIFPAESVKNTQTLPATSDDLKSNGIAHTYSTWFYDLLGGRTEYVVTIACMIGKSRMKGEKLVTTLVPYGADKPRSGMQKSAGTDQVEIFWDPPKGEFTKYTLWVDKINRDAAMRAMLSVDGVASRAHSILRLPQSPSTGSVPDGGEAKFEKGRQMENLSYKLTSYTILGLDPGELYKVELATKTGSVTTRQTISDLVMTKPLSPVSLFISVESPTSAVIHCSGPKDDGTHSCLKGIEMALSSAAGGSDIKMALNKKRFEHQISRLKPATEYTVTVSSVAHFKSSHSDAPAKRYDSDPVSETFTTPPEEVRNLRLDYATPNSIVVKWDQPNHALAPDAAMKYKLAIELAPTADGDGGAKYSREELLSADKTAFNFSQLPDPDGTGRQFVVSAQVAVHFSREGGGLKEVHGKKVFGRFETLPLKPSNLRAAGDDQRTAVAWTPSPSRSVVRYRVTWRRNEDGARADEADVAAAVAADRGDAVQFALTDLEESSSVYYKVNVYAVAEAAPGVLVESRELHEKFVFKTVEEGQPPKLVKFEESH